MTDQFSDSHVRRCAAVLFGRFQIGYGSTNKVVRILVCYLVFQNIRCRVYDGGFELLPYRFSGTAKHVTVACNDFGEVGPPTKRGGNYAGDCTPPYLKSPLCRDLGSANALLRRGRCTN